MARSNRNSLISTTSINPYSASDSIQSLIDNSMDARVDNDLDSALDDILDDSCDCPECNPCGHYGLGYPTAVTNVTITINGIPVLDLERPTIGDGH